MDKPCLLEFQPNRVRRNYNGGAGIEKLRGTSSALDSDRPEEWIASLVEAKNPGLVPVVQEGLSICRVKGQDVLFRDVLQSDPTFYLGADFAPENGLDLGFLVKLLDSSMRLHVQAHPTAAFAQEHLNSRYGKLECYYILSVREGTQPYIRLGFQHSPGKSEWRRIIKEQDMTAMDACFERVPVAPGEVWYIPGGVPHAIGENILMVEIMEPSDLVVRCEFNREGLVVPPEARFMGKGLEYCLDIFDYSEQSVQQVTEKYRLAPVRIDSKPGAVSERLAEFQTFAIHRLTLQPNAHSTLAGGGPRVFLATKGEAIIRHGNQTSALQQGNGLFAAASQSLEITTISGAELCYVTGNTRGNPDQKARS
jgi:mannose-6-phosphate isomerase